MTRFTLLVLSIIGATSPFFSCCGMEKYLRDFHCGGCQDFTTFNKEQQATLSFLAIRYPEDALIEVCDRRGNNLLHALSLFESDLAAKVFGLCLAFVKKSNVQVWQEEQAGQEEIGPLDQRRLFVENARGQSVYDFLRNAKSPVLRNIYVRPLIERRFLDRRTAHIEGLWTEPPRGREIRLGLRNVNS